MKTLVLIACLLAVTYAVDFEEVNHFNQLIKTCAIEIDVPPFMPEPKIFKCVGDKLGMYEDDVPIMSKLIQYIDKIVFDYNKDEVIFILEMCKTKAYQEGSGSNYEKTIQAIKCTLDHNLVALIAQPY